MYESVTGDSSVVFTVAITSITDSTVVGTFSGKVHNANLDTITIKEGKFSGRTQPIIIVPTVSAGTLGTTADSCTGATIAGTYKKSVTLTTANTVTVSVNVSTIGTYSIRTDTIKGIYFNKTGSFTSTGVQSLTLQGVGTPTDSAAAARFTVKYGASACKFTVKIDTGAAVVVVPTTGDYFPLTTNTNWSYDVFDSASNTTDTMYQVVTGTTKSVVGNTFNIILENPSGDSSFVRKGSGLYYSTVDIAALTGFGSIGQTTILKDNVALGTTWSETLPAAPLTLKFDYTIVAKAVPVTIGSFNFPDVIKVRTVISSGVSPAISTIAILETWYAKGVGLIYAKNVSTLFVSSSETTTIRRFTIF